VTIEVSENLVSNIGLSFQFNGYSRWFPQQLAAVNLACANRLLGRSRYYSERPIRAG
jgi:hypothetical protein